MQRIAGLNIENIKRRKLPKQIIIDKNRIGIVVNIEIISADIPWRLFRIFD